MLNKNEKILIGFIILIGLMMMTLKNPQLEAVKNGDSTLVCKLKSGDKIINPEMVTNYDMKTQYWTFKNGGASNCVVYENKETLSNN